jgi:hypothetical protein
VLQIPTFLRFSICVLSCSGALAVLCSFADRTLHVECRFLGRAKIDATQARKRERMCSGIQMSLSHRRRRRCALERRGLLKELEGSHHIPATFAGLRGINRAHRAAALTLLATLLCAHRIRVHISFRQQRGGVAEAVRRQLGVFGGVLTGSCSGSVGDVVAV